MTPKPMQDKIEAEINKLIDPEFYPEKNKAIKSLINKEVLEGRIDELENAIEFEGATAGDIILKMISRLTKLIEIDRSQDG